MEKQLTAKRILIADDDHNILAALKLLLTSENYHVTLASHPEQVVKLYQDDYFDCVFLDLNFHLDTTSGEEGLALIDQLYAIDDTVPLIVMTGWATVALAVNAMQKGAVDFIQKPWDNKRLLTVVATQIRLAQQEHQSAMLSQENHLLKAQQGYFEPMVAYSDSMKRVMIEAEQVAKSDINILITGENGTGKSLLAEQIHQLSTRKKYSLISVNMGAISENLFESEMFGHVKGAFTDARETRIGRFELAEQGSLFLDEIGNIPLSQQGKLLRVLESQKFEKVGASKTQLTDARIIAATNADIESLVNDGLFRQDLLYRLNTIEIRLPPLRERKGDILPMAEMYLQRYGQKYNKNNLSFSEDAIEQLEHYDWPGNIRELNHMIERAVVLVQTCVISTVQLAINIETSPKNTKNSAVNHDVESESNQPLAELEKAIILRRIQHNQGNMINTAKSLGLSRSAFYRRIEKYQL